jgi:coenzyme F420-reducing hydrogenase alpha subunit
VTHRNRQLVVSALARVEGEGALDIVVADGEVTGTRLRIYEPPRFFEAFLRGRQFTEVTDITSRICGICPVAYQTSAWRAIEDACGIGVGPQIEALRRLLYCGEWVSSHALHIYFLHAPDFLGYPDVVAMARDHRGAVERGLALKKTGNAIMETVGGRAIHPVNPRVGGFYRAPARADLQALVPALERALEDALATAAWVAGFRYPDAEITGDLVAVHDPDRYPVDGDHVATASGLVFPARDFDLHVTEHQVPYSTALHATLDGGPYLTGPLARYALARDRLTPAARQAAAAAGLGPVCRNPYRSIAVRAVEIAYAAEEALRIIAAYERPEPSFVPVEPATGTGHGISEAPRGLLYHRYRLAADGTVAEAVIVPPTSQNQAAIEDDLRRTVAGHLDLDDAALTALCERVIRNYDPCISCAAHFLDLRVERR